MYRKEVLDLYVELLPPEQPPPPGISSLLSIRYNQPKYGSTVPLDDKSFSEKYVPTETMHVRSPIMHSDFSGFKELSFPVQPARASKILDKDAREALIAKYSKYYPKTEEELYKVIV